ncbi:MAG: 23S rRNA methyltransferase [Gammaproteobacteria bacterium RIFCSPHIGHO2_12_FULL_42_10]|nr:MAG: 23S rRNA methyltransferase [Gammaproteobacteria bacterium RIFCSPHIGHO2_12_FULL_42_10]
MPPSSARWLQEHFSDDFVKKARAAGYRSRAVYKLLELHEKNRLFKPGMLIIELGAAPGSWSQLVVSLVRPRGRVIAIDRLPMDPIEDVEIIEGDFVEPETVDAILQKIGETKADWILSDMAPNMSGHVSVDIPQAMYLAELACDFALQTLNATGGLLMKVFQGEGFDPLLTHIRKHFSKVVVRKPQASRGRSREVYIVAMKLK